MGQAYPQSHSNKQTPDLLTPGQLKPRPPHSSVCPCASAWLARESSSSSSAVHSCACSWVPSLSPQGFRKQMVPPRDTGLGDVGRTGLSSGPWLTGFFCYLLWVPRITPCLHSHFMCHQT